MKNQNTIISSQYVVVGRFSDEENYCKIVEANSSQDAGHKLEDYVRKQDDPNGNEFYIEHCQKLTEMQQSTIKESADILTVGTLRDVVDSQLCLYGNRALFEPNNTFILFAGDGTEHPIIECVSHDEQCDGDGGLEALFERLKGIEDSEIIYCSNDNQIKGQFSLGFKSSVDGFVETINSKELIQPTVVIN
jgi:hypothetical protein